VPDPAGVDPKPSRFPWWIEWPALGVIYAAFEGLRDHAAGTRGPAEEHARWIVDLERWTWTLHEHGVNDFVAHHKSLAQVMDISYGTVHFLVPPLVLIWLWRRHPLQYRRWLTILAALTVVSLPVFWRFPVAPPRLYVGVPAVTGTASCQRAVATAGARLHFVDTDACFGGLGPLDRGNFKDANPWAAMPSLHVGWSSWSAAAIIAGFGLDTARRRRWRWLALLYPAWTFVVVTGTANHWFLDTVGGWGLLAVVWFGVTRWMEGRHRGKEDARLAPPVVGARRL